MLRDYAVTPTWMTRPGLVSAAEAVRAVDEGTEDQEVFVFLLEFDQVPCAVPLLARPG